MALIFGQHHISETWDLFPSFVPLDLNPLLFSYLTPLFLSFLCLLPHPSLQIPSLPPPSPFSSYPFSSFSLTLLFSSLFSSSSLTLFLASSASNYIILLVPILCLSIPSFLSTLPCPLLPKPSLPFVLTEPQPQLHLNLTLTLPIMNTQYWILL